MIPRRARRPKMGVREPDRIVCPGHLKWVRGHECVFKFGMCEGKIEAAHVRMGTDGGMGMKPSDCYAVPLCERHHRRQHQIGEESFWRGVDPIKIAADLWRLSPHRINYERRKDKGNG